MLLYLSRRATFKVSLALTLNSLEASGKIISLSLSIFGLGLLLVVELLVILGVGVRVGVGAICNEPGVPGVRHEGYVG